MSIGARMNALLPAAHLWLGMAPCATGLMANAMGQAVPFLRVFETVLSVLVPGALARPPRRWRSRSAANEPGLAQVEGDAQWRRIPDNALP